MTEAKDPALLVAEHELHLARKRIEQQQQTIEALARNLKRTASARTATIAPATDEAKRAPPTPDAMALAPGSGWPSLPLPKTPLPPPPGLGAQSLAGRKTKVVAFAVFGLEGEALEAAVRSVADRQRQAMDFVPVFLTDSPVHDAFRRRAYAVEYFTKDVHLRAVDREVLRQRVASAVLKWSVTSIVEMAEAGSVAAVVTNLFKEALDAPRTIGGAQLAHFVPEAERMERKLWAGFSRSALAVLETLKRSAKPNERFAAGWAIASWCFANRDYWRALDHVDVMRNADEKRASEKRVLLMECECLIEVGRRDDARKLLDNGVRVRGFDPDLCWAYANTYAYPVDGNAATDNIRLGWINRVFVNAGFAVLEKTDPLKPLAIDNLHARVVPTAVPFDPPRVTIIVPAYNAAKTLGTALRGIADQTWPNVEAVIVDDCSTDETWEIARAFQASANFPVVAVRRDRNEGVNSARNFGLTKATGALITIHDADDWSHPQKIESQVLRLLRDPASVGVLGAWIRTSNNLRAGWEYRPRNTFFDWNTSSFLFRNGILRNLGGWDNDRDTGDTEFIWRAEMFGAVSRQLASVPLSLSLLHSASLTQAAATNIRTIHFGPRREYREAARHWHGSIKSLEELRLVPSRPRPFPIPGMMLAERVTTVDVDFLFVMDFNLGAGAFLSTLSLINAAIAYGYDVAVFQWRRFDLDVSAPLNSTIRSMAQNGALRVVAPGEHVKAKTVIVGYPSILQHPVDLFPKIEFDDLFIRVNQMASRLNTGEDFEYDPLTARQTLVELFGSEGSWVPVSPLIRRLMKNDPRYPEPHPADFLPLVNLGAFGDKPLDWRGEQLAEPVVGRHCRDHYTKWPSDPVSLRAAYCADLPCTVRILGGASKAKAVIGTIPQNWEVLEWDAVSAPTFLTGIDFFVHYTHERYVEANSRSVVEAMASGKPVILPPEFKETYGDAASYAQPSEVWRVVQEMWANQQAYLNQAQKGRDFVERRCSWETFNELVWRLKSRESPTDEFRGKRRPFKVHALLTKPERLFSRELPRTSCDFKQRIQARFRRWYREPGRESSLERQIVSLGNKKNMRAFYAERNIPLPKQHFSGRAIGEFDFSQIGDRFVVKPTNSWNSDCVMLFDDDRELMSGDVVSRSTLRDYIANRIRNAEHVTTDSEFVVEEFVRDIDPAFPIPRDFKVYAGGGHAWIIQVINRNRKKTSRCFLRNGSAIDDPFQLTYRKAESIGIIPPFEGLIDIVDRMSSELPKLLRFDFYMTERGPVFGELTTVPFAGKHFTAAGDRALSWLMELYPDDDKRDRFVVSRSSVSDAAAALA